MRKLINRFLIFCILLAFFILLDSYRSANREFSINSSPLSKAEQHAALEKLGFEPLETETHNKRIESYTVNASGEIAILSKPVFESNESWVNVFNSDGEFLYGCHFNSGRGRVSFYWKGDSLFIYNGLLYVMELDSLGQCREVRKEETDQTKSSMVNAMNLPKKTVNGVTYKKKGSSKIVRIEDGEEIVVVDLKR